MFGLALLSTDAVTLGATAVPDPSAEPEYPWIWYGQASMFAMTTLALGGNATAFSELLTIDSKAMRKVKPGETLTIVGQYVNVSGNPAMRVASGQTRVLIGT